MAHHVLHWLRFDPCISTCFVFMSICPSQNSGANSSPILVPTKRICWFKTWPHHCHLKTGDAQLPPRSDSAPATPWKCFTTSLGREERNGPKACQSNCPSNMHVPEETETYEKAGTLKKTGVLVKNPGF